jgi:hypothetical protein
MNRTVNSQYNTDVKAQNRQLQTISETNPQANNSFYDNQLVYPQPSAPKQKRGKTKTSDGNMSMVLVMSNLMTKRKTGKRKPGQSLKP